MKSLHLFLALSILLIGNSCISSDRTIVKKMTQSGLSFDADWHKTLEKSKGKMKNAWLDSNDETISSFNTMFDLDLKESDLKDLVGIPTEVYEIDSAAFSKWNASIPLEQVLTLKKNEAELYLTKDKNVLFHLYMRYEDNNWDSRSVIGLKKAARKSYSKLYFENKLPLIRVFIKRDTQPKGPKLECTVCIKDGRYYVAFDEEPFEEYLTNLKARIAR